MKMRMKKIIGLVLALVMVMGSMPMSTMKAYAAEENVAIDETNFPDATFREYIKEKFDTDKNDKLSQEERNEVREIEINDKGITTLKGIEQFPNLSSLDCSNIGLNSIDVSKNANLKYFYCNKNRLTELDVSHNPKLIYLFCRNNQLRALNVKENKKLSSLFCADNKLSELDVTKNSVLKKLNCYNNQLEELDVTNNTDLQVLSCYDNQLKGLNVSKNKNLTELNCSTNQLTELDVRSNTALTYLECGSNKQLKELDVSQNTELIKLWCYRNQLGKLDVSKNSKLTVIKAYNNPLTYLKLGSNNYSEKQLDPFYSIEVPKGVSEIKFPEGFNASNIQDKTIKGISVNGDKLEWDEKTKETEFEYKLCDDPQTIVEAKVTFREVRNQALEDATKLVEAAEEDKTEDNYTTAKVAVDALAKGSGKTGLEDKLKDVRSFLDELKKAKDGAKETIGKLQHLTDEEKDKYTGDVDKATDKDGVKQVVTAAEAKDKENKAAKDAQELQDAKDKAKEEIGKLTNLSPEEKAKAENDVDKATDKDGVNQVVTAAKEQDEKNKAAKDAKELQDAKDKAKEEIDKLPNLSKEEKEGFDKKVDEQTTIEDVKKVVEEAKAKDKANKEAEEAKAKDKANKEAEDAKKAAEEAKKVAEEAKKKAEEAKKAAEEAAKKAEEAKKAAENETDPTKKPALEDEAKKASEEAEKKAEEAKKAEDEAKAAEEAKKAADEAAKKAEEKVKEAEKKQPATPDDKKNAKDAIDKLPNLTNEEKKEAKDKVDNANTKGEVEKAVEEAKAKDEQNNTAHKGNTGGGWIWNYTPQAPSTSDEKKETKHDTVVKKGYIFGYPEGTFRPNGSMTRAEAAAMFARLANLNMSQGAAASFNDVSNHWAKASIDAMVSAGYMKGYPDGNFRPEGKITRAEFAQMIKAMDKANGAQAPFKDIQGHWAQAAIAQAYGNGRINGYPDGTFRPNNDITRAEAVTMFNNLYNRKVDAKGLEQVQAQILDFTDVGRNNWAYFNIVAASNTAEVYYADKNKNDETWVRVIQNWKQAQANQ